MRKGKEKCFNTICFKSVNLQTVRNSVAGIAPFSNVRKI